MIYTITLRIERRDQHYLNTDRGAFEECEEDDLGYDELLEYLGDDA